METVYEDFPHVKKTLSSSIIVTIFSALFFCFFLLLVWNVSCIPVLLRRRILVSTTQGILVWRLGANIFLLCYFWTIKHLLFIYLSLAAQLLTCYSTRHVTWQGFGVVGISSRIVHLVEQKCVTFFIGHYSMVLIIAINIFSTCIFRRKLKEGKEFVK